MMKYWLRMKELCEERNLSFFSVMQSADVSFSSSYQMKKKGVPPTVKTINKFCDTLHISVFHFFNSPIFKSNYSQSVLINQWRGLSDIEKEAIILTLNEFKKIRLSK